MKKNLLLLLMLFTLSACVSQQGEESSFGGVNVAKTEVEVLPIENIVTQPDEFREALQNFKEVPPSSIKQKASYSELLVQDLRKELPKKGVKVNLVGEQIDLIMPNKVIFGGNQSKIQPSFEETIIYIAQSLKKYDQTMIQIIGYTDDSESILTAQDISLQKANVIADFLKDYGIDAGRIIVDGAGAENPISTNATPAGREQNRRVEMTIISLQ